MPQTPKSSLLVTQARFLNPASSVSILASSRGSLGLRSGSCRPLAEVRHVPARVGSPAPLRDRRAHVTKEDAEAAAWRSRHGPVDVALPLFCDDRRKLRPGLFESGPQPFRSTIFPVKSGGLYYLSYRLAQGGLCPKRTRMERTGHPVARGGGRCSDKAGDWMSVWRPVASGSLWPLRVGLSPFQQRATRATQPPVAERSKWARERLPRTIPGR
jgi:hypothetical protein